MRGAISALVVSACVLSQGCGTLIATQWPMKSERRVVKREARVAVRAAPAGAVVTTADGKTVLGPAPRDIAAEYDEVLTWKEHSYWGPGIGGAVATATFTYAMIQAMTTKEVGEPFSRFWLGMTAVGIGDMYGAILRIPIFVQRNMLARREPTRTAVPLDVPYRVNWDGFDPVEVTLRFPHDTSVVATRPTVVTFEQALLHWERTAARAPTPGAMLELATVYLGRATARSDAADAAKAIAYLERYLAMEGVSAESRAEAEAMLARARELTR